MKKILIAIFTSLFMGFVGMILGAIADEIFGGVNFEFIPYVSIVFVIISMGTCIIYYNDKK